jgi:long-chain acyl-CoA synthetase
MMEILSGRLSAPKTRGALIHHFLEKSTEVFPDKIALVHEDQRATFSQMNGLANQLAFSLIKAGLGVGDRAVLICENSFEYIFSYYGILKAGGIAVSLNPELKPDNIAELLDELEPKVLIISSKFEQMIDSPALTRFPVRNLYVIHPRLSNRHSEYGVSSLYEVLSCQPDHNPDLDIHPQSCAAIIYTSGSAGRPKGVMLSHANIVANTRAIVEYLKLTSDDVQMVVLPFFYVMGKSLLNTHMAVGGKVVINNKFAYTASVLKQMGEEGVTGFSGVPSTYTQLLYKSPLAQYRDKLPALRYCSQAGGHMSKIIILELLKILPVHTRLFIMYGATEASARLTYVPPDFLLSKIDSIGIPVSGVSIKILSPEGLVLKPGETGELVAGGDNMMLGYFKDDDSTRKVLDRHGYHTGDLGYVDGEGFLFLTGRKDNQIKVAGHRINPQEIEDAIIESGRAIESLIFVIQTSFGAERLAGLAVPRRKSSNEVGHILKYCSTKLPKYKIPESLLLVDAIPKNSTGKPDREKSLELFQRQVEKEKSRQP